MKKESIKNHLKSYSIFGKRQTTINHAFASAIASNDEYDEKIVSDAIKFLGQNPEDNLVCVYCGEKAETWDHVFGLVKNYNYSGFGHVIGNLLPCCKKCNSAKGNKNWQDFINITIDNKILKQEKSKIIGNYLKKYLSDGFSYNSINKICHKDIISYEKIKKQIFYLMAQADVIAKSIKNKIKAN